MKFLKLSLAAVMACGMAQSSFGAPLEEAIKDIDVSGFARYRYENKHWTKSGKDVWAWGAGLSNGTSYSDAFHRFTLDLNFKATLDDNFFSVIGLRYDTRDISGAGNLSTSAFKGISNTHGGLAGIGAKHNNAWGSANGDSLSIRQYYIGYKGIPDTTILAGRQPINSFFTDDVVGTGIKVLNNSIEGLTLAAIAFDNIEDDADLADTKMGKKWSIGDIYDPSLVDNTFISQNNLYGAAAIYSYEWLNAQAWYAHLQNVVHLWALDLGANYALNDDFSVRARINVAGSHFTKSFLGKNHSIKTDTTNKITSISKESGVANSTLVAVDLGLSYDFLSFDAGYITYGKKGKVSAHTLEDEGWFIKSGEYAFDYTDFQGKHNIWFAKIGAKFDAYSLGFDYTYDKEKDSGDDYIKYNAYTVRAGYKYSDKLNFNAWWEYQTVKLSNEKTKDYKEKYNTLRIDARYNF